MYTIRIDSNVPDSTYFTSSDVAPICDKNAITLLSGKGSRRSWGAPETTSTVVVNFGKFAAIHVGFHHKHRGGQQWYYFVAGERRTWAQLSPAQQRRVIASLSKAPRWAKTPGSVKGSKKAA